MYNQIFHDVNIEQDLGIPLSYDAAWKIFNRWPREVRGQRRRLGEKTCQKMPPRRSCCYCSQQNCTTRCPFFGLCKKQPANTEEKIRGIISHAHAEQPRLKGVLRTLNDWYNTRCTADTNDTLDLTKLGQLKIQYKIPTYQMGQKKSKRGGTSRVKVAANGSSIASYGAKGKWATKDGKKMKELSLEDCSSSELYYTIEKQLRNLSVSQSRLKHMSASLCRLAYSKRNAGKIKPKPRSYKYSGARMTGNTSTSSSSRNPSSKTSSFGSKSSSKKSSKSSKSSNSTKDSSSSKSSKENKSNKTSNSDESSKSNNSNKNRTSSDIYKSANETKTSESSDSNGCSIKLAKSLRFADIKKIRKISAAADKQQNDCYVNNNKAANGKIRISHTKASKLRMSGCKPNSRSSQTSESYRTVILKQASAGSTKTRTQLKNNRGGAKTPQDGPCKKSEQQTTSGSDGCKRIKKAPKARISRPTIATLSKKTTKSKCNVLSKRKTLKCLANKVRA